MEKILHQTDWYKLYEITEPSTLYNPYAFVEIGVDHCPECGHRYCMRFKKEFKCNDCGFTYKIKTPARTWFKNTFRAFII